MGWTYTAATADLCPEQWASVCMLDAREVLVRENSVHAYLVYVFVEPVLGCETSTNQPYE